MAYVAERVRTASGRSPRSPGTGPWWPSDARAYAVVVVLAAAAVVAAWLPFLHRPLTSDEGGYLLVARQWHAGGSSLYGDYWVDRPPLLLWLFELAGRMGPLHAYTAGPAAPGVRLLGAAAAGVSVALTGVVGVLVAPRSARRRTAAVVLAAVLLASPLVGVPETDGELLAVPFVLAGVIGLVAARRTSRTHRALLPAAAAGAAGTAAALVKQDLVDVFVLALAMTLLARGRGRASSVMARVAAFGAGAAAALGIAVVAAAARGTSPAGLWYAVVTFRLRASEVIGSSASTATPARLGLLVAAFVGSGSALLLAVHAVPLLRGWWRARRRPDAALTDRDGPTATSLAGPALAMVAWELVGVVMGGSYWLHYLTATVPGLVLLMLTVRPSPRQRQVLVGCLALALVVNAAAWTVELVAPVDLTGSDARVVGYLRSHAERNDGAVVAYGHAEIVAGSGLHSPYPDLWSLPVRVRDPHLTRLTATMTGRHGPRWMVTPATGLASWGLDSDRAQGYLLGHYTVRARYGTWRIWERDAPGPR